MVDSFLAVSVSLDSVSTAAWSGVPSPFSISISAPDLEVSTGACGAQKRPGVSERVLSAGVRGEPFLFRLTFRLCAPCLLGGRGPCLGDSGVGVSSSSSMGEGLADDIDRANGCEAGTVSFGRTRNPGTGFRLLQLDVVSPESTVGGVRIGVSPLGETISPRSSLACGVIGVALLSAE